MDFKAIQNLMKEMNQSELTFLEIESDGIHIKMQKDSQYKSEIIPVEAPPINIENIPLELKSSSKKMDIKHSDEIKSAKSDISDKDFKIIKSPIVGTFYSSSSPDKPSFVNTGDRIKKGQILCIIEAMKLMNEIESEYDGEVAEILVKNEEAVQFGQPLFKIIQS